ncbi:hypothetical protein KEM56_003867 [Ascosphaera pollenicola]|nr:hypothetical protein KEM56_003867 [Ascosphaera pollenicola]
MLPLGLLNVARGHPMLVELKNGETLNGHLVNCDNFMNLVLKAVVQTSPEGDKFMHLPEVYVRGNNVSSANHHDRLSARDSLSSVPAIPLHRMGITILIASDAQIKYLRIPDEIVDLAREQQQQTQNQNRNRGGHGHYNQQRDYGRSDRGGRGGRGGRARGRGRG